ncbi:MAG: DEAD/DEAH box helicase [Micrococcales bacterium]|nr:DEAD/DEAH box helicase [Micrococcales bacterium]
MPFVGYPGVDPIQLDYQVGRTMSLRGNTYFRTGRVIVKTITYDPKTARLYGKVRGTGHMPYECMVWLEAYGPDRSDWRIKSNWCTCPVGAFCKHVTALVLRANQLAEASAAEGVPEWEPWRLALTSLIEDRPKRLEAQAMIPVAVQFQVEGLDLDEDPELDPRNYVEPSVLFRFVQRSTRGGWISYKALHWYGLQNGQAPPTMPPEQAAWCTVFAALPNYVSAYRGWLDISVWRNPWVFSLLRQAAEVGIELTTKSRGDRVLLADQLEVGMDALHLGKVLKLTKQIKPDNQPSFTPVLLSPVGSSGCVAVDLTNQGLDIWLGPLGSPLNIDELNRTLPVAIPAESVPTFWSEVFPALARTIPLISHGPDIEPPPLPEPTLVATLTNRTDSGVDLAWHWQYPSPGEPIIFELGSAKPADLTGTLRHHQRDLQLEQNLVKAAGQEMTKTPGLAPPSNQVQTLTGLVLARFLTQTMDSLQRLDNLQVDINGQLPQVSVVQAAPTVDLEVISDDAGDWFDLGVTVSFAGQQVPFKELFTALANGEDQLFLENGLLVSLNHPELDRLRRLIAEAASLSDRGDRPRINRYQANLWSELEELANDVDIPTQWQETLAIMRALQNAAPEPLEPPATLKAILRPYQHQAFEWLVFLWRYSLGGVLADDMGLGKTVEALALIAQAREEEPIAPPFLVVAPSSVVANWASEAARFTPMLNVKLAARTQAKTATSLAELHQDADLIITSYAVFRLDNPAFADLAWSGLILDEAQFAKNHATKANQQARALPVPFKLAVTGTPMENSLIELWAVFGIVAPGLLGRRRQFTDNYVNQMADPETLQRLRRRLKPLMMRRSKELVAPELPPRMEQVLEVELKDRHRAIYDTHLQRERRRVLGLLDSFEENRFAIFRSLTKLRRLALDVSLVDPEAGQAPSSKLEVLMEQLDDVIGSGHRALVFSQFTSYLKLIAQRLEAAGVDHCYLDGSTTNRANVIGGFKKGKAPVFLISLKAGGFGLNLTEADYVFLMDPWWNPATEAQAVDRTHRIGQDKPVMVFRLVAAATIEDKVMALKARKAALFDAVLDDDGTFSQQLTAADVRSLFS